ncbi:MAG: CPBP family intramembrane metalloprotease, partial [Armatimonadetes bacterium]|nr:CPBP family intramembrane metalloprotease [Armatimonadota bacterium]
QRYYPRYPWAKTEALSLLLSIVGWGLYFFVWEFFFRGFLLNLLALRYGAFAIVIQMVPFVMMHFPKPEVETFAAIIAGLALGIMCYHGKSFIGAWLLHWGAATLLDQLVIWHGSP